MTKSSTMKTLNDNQTWFQPSIPPCTECFHSQNTLDNGSSKKVRRSNSCPGGNESCFLTVNQLTNQMNQRGGITKRWHSLMALHTSLPNIDIERSVDTSRDTTAQRVPMNQSSPHKSWLPFNANSGISTSLSLSKRVGSLFSLGVMLALILNLLQKQKQVTVFSPGVFGDVLNSAWWIPPTFGLAAIAIGLLYPKLDQMLGNHSKLNQEWSSVMRCIAVFVGINHASAKITFDSNIHLSITLAMLSFGLWYFFDQSLSGLGLGLAITGVATTVTQFLVAMDVFGYSNPDFLYMQSWVPCLYFSGGVTIGAVGRALATFDDVAAKHHKE